MTFPKGRSLEDELGYEAYARLASRASAIVPPFMLRRLRPWAAATALLYGLMDSKESPDLLLLRDAESAGKETVFLETLDEQVDALEAAFAVKDLLDIVDGYDAVKAQIDEMMRAYQRGDPVSLELIALDPGMTRVLERMLYARTDHWVPEIEQLMEHGDAFVAV